jgi:S-methylmethionine-dependent homocysteine/selenocysteine methylase
MYKQGFELPHFRDFHYLDDPAGRDALHRYYREIADEVGLDPETTIYSGCIGPRGDAYQTNLALTAESSEDYHAEQVETFRKAGVDLVTALTLNSTAEAIGGAPAYYMINCSHPTDFGPALNQGEWVKRIRGIRANASSLEHGQLCQLGHLEEGDATEPAQQYRELARLYPQLNVFGGCCGTDHDHVRKICEAVLI